MVEYEFGEDEAEVILTMVQRMKALSILLLIVGLVAFLPQFMNGFSLGQFLGGILWIVMGIFFFLPLDNFKRIVNSKDRDIRELVQGFRELDRGWTFVLVILLLHRVYLVYSIF